MKRKALERMKLLVERLRKKVEGDDSSANIRIVRDEPQLMLTVYPSRLGLC
jgi:hypothetical protein